MTSNQATYAFRMGEVRVQRECKADQDRWIEFARYAMQQARRLALWLELDVEERSR